MRGARSGGTGRRPATTAAAPWALPAVLVLLAIASPGAGASPGEGVATWRAANAEPAGAWPAHRSRQARPASSRRRPLRARPAIVGGSQIEIGQAPWQVAVSGEFTFESEKFFTLCGGSILSSTRILTAAHCVLNPFTGERLAPGSLHVLAGASKLELEAGAQESVGVALRVHPYFEPASPAPVPDDVAVLSVKALTLSERAKPIALVAAGSEPGEGAVVNLTGYGRQNPEARPNGNLYSIALNVRYSRECGGESDAVFVCASTAAGSPCSGDSGSGLTVPGGEAGLLGVTNAVQVLEGRRCAAGAMAAFANLAAPEVALFVSGSEAPPRAPRGGGAGISGVTRVGSSYTCTPGHWSGAPTITYAFIDGAGAKVLQQGASPSYALSSADVGRSILCEVRASNSGGTGLGRTLPLGPVEPAPPPPPVAVPIPVSPAVIPVPAGGVAGVSVFSAPEPSRITIAGIKIAVTRAGLALVRLDCTGGLACRGKLKLEATHPVHGRSRLDSIGGASFSITKSRVTAVKIQLNALGRKLLTAAHGHLNVRLALIGLETLPTHSELHAVRLLAQKPGKK